jgi:hypothetical protein
MKSQALQQFVKKIFSDENTRMEFESSPDKVLARYNMTEQEKNAVLHTYTKVGLVTAESPALEAALDPTGTWFSPTP